MITKDLLGYLSVFFTLLSGVPYIFSVLKGRTKPHVFTWIIWALLSAIAAAAQYTGNAGPGAWATECSATVSLVIAVLSFSHGERDITLTDWVAFAGGLTAILLWYLTSNPLMGSLLATASDASGYYPTFRKSYKKPKEEMILSYVASNMKHVASICAMTIYSATTLAYPVIIFGMNCGLIFLLIWRRRKTR
jgi:hypothetical protein